jgi:hypothetical protein
MTNLDLFVGPAIHTQRLDLGHVGAQLAVDGGAPHAQKDPQLSPTSAPTRLSHAATTAEGSWGRLWHRPRSGSWDTYTP